MRTEWVGLMFAVPVLVAGCEWWMARPVKQSPGVLVSTEPVQTQQDSTTPFDKPGYQIKALAQYEIKARVLSSERYRWDAGADLVPVDLAVGWGPMSDTAVLDKIEIWQSGRWYQWRAQAFPIPPDEVTRHSANMHLIAADKSVAKKISRARNGQVVTMRGHLVEAKRADGFVWTSSLSRVDRGAGACELMWVTAFETE